MIDGRTVLTGLLGSPVGHSISPLMHNTAFQALGLNYAYLCFDVGKENLHHAVDGLVSLGAKGWNCTMPDKVRMAELCDTLSTAASLIGAVNTVVNDNGRLVGHNTDGVGYMRSVKEAGFNVIGEKVTLFGTGGASTSILVQAALDGVKEISVFARPGASRERTAELIQRIKKESDCYCHLCEYTPEVMRQELAESRMVINGTNVGMSPYEEGCIVPDATMLHPELIVSDIIYNPRITKLLAMAKDQGCAWFNGLYMLLYQGAEAFRLWTGQDMPVEMIKEKYFDGK